MKKNISINLQGMIFHVEEDGYELLSQYLASVKMYFATYQGHEEIVADIEARMAEKFMAKLSPGKQVISLVDVQDLIAQMGTVADFAAIDQDEEEDNTYQKTYTTTDSEPVFAKTGKKLFLDGSRKMIGGVAAGIANYLNVDPFWIRLAFLFLFIGAPFTGGVSGIVLIIYIILWAALPTSHSLAESKVKKLYRDPDNKKIAGVASGLGLYLGIDISIVRVLFLVSIFLGGFGLLAYFIIWIMVPEAKSITEKVQMHGQPITLSSIEESLKKNLNINDNNGEESTLGKLVLLPFRLLGQLLEWMASVLPPLLSFLITLIRIFAGIILLFGSLALLITLLVFLAAIFGNFDTNDIVIGNIPVELLSNSFPLIGIIAGFAAAIIPAISIFLLALMLLTKRSFIKAPLGWTMFALWIVSIATLITSIILTQHKFRFSGEYTEQKVYQVAPYNTVLLDGHSTVYLFNDDISVTFESYAGSDIKVVKTYLAKGKDEDEAVLNARQIEYKINQRDSTLLFDNAFSLKPGARFRDQEVSVTVYMPQDKEYRISRDMISIIGHSNFEGDMDYRDISKNNWRISGFTFECLTCTPTDTTTLETDEDGNFNFEINIDSPKGSLIDMDDYENTITSYNVANFTKIEADGGYHIKVNQDPNFNVQSRGNKKQIKDLRVTVDGDYLKIKHKKGVFTFDIFDSNEPVLIEVNMPKLNAVNYAGAIKSDITGFTSDELEIDQAGAVQTFIRTNTHKLNIDLTGASIATLEGKTDILKADAVGACKIDASKFKAEDAWLDFTGASQGDFVVSKRLDAEASGASNITYSGNPKARIEKSGASNIRKR